MHDASEHTVRALEQNEIADAGVPDGVSQPTRKDRAPSLLTIGNQVLAARLGQNPRHVSFGARLVEGQERSQLSLEKWTKPESLERLTALKIHGDSPKIDEN
jgi:hypothetical protein